MSVLENGKEVRTIKRKLWLKILLLVLSAPFVLTGFFLLSLPFTDRAAEIGHVYRFVIVIVMVIYFVIGIKLAVWSENRIKELAKNESTMREALNLSYASLWSYILFFIGIWYLVSFLGSSV